MLTGYIRRLNRAYQVCFEEQETFFILYYSWNLAPRGFEITPLARGTGGVGYIRPVEDQITWHSSVVAVNLAKESVMALAAIVLS